MDTQELDRALLATLEDGRLSRTERHALSALLRETPLDANKRAQLRARAFGLAKERLADADARTLLDWVEDFVKLLTQLEANAPAVSASRGYFSPGEACLSAILGELSRAGRTADICVFTITDDRIARAIRRSRRIPLRSSSRVVRSPPLMPLGTSSVSVMPQLSTFVMRSTPSRKCEPSRRQLWTEGGAVSIASSLSGSCSVPSAAITRARRCFARFLRGGSSSSSSSAAPSVSSAAGTGGVVVSGEGGVASGAVGATDASDPGTGPVVGDAGAPLGAVAAAPAAPSGAAAWGAA